MSFGAPLAFAFLGLAAPVIALYFLKLRRKKLTVSSTWLWFRSINDLRVNAPFQRLRKSLLLFLQLLLIALAALALARPLASGGEVKNKLWVLLIDRSASMAMTDVAPSRLESAKDVARAAIKDLGQDDQVLVIAFARQPQVLTPVTRDRALVERAITAITPSESATRITEAFQVALANTQAFEESELILLTDGNFEPIDVPIESASVKVTYVPIGGTPRNAGLTTLKVQELKGEDDPWTVFATIDHFSETASEASLELRVNGALKFVRPVPLPPGESVPVVFELTQPVPEVVEARLILEDHLAADNRAWTVVRHRKPRLLLISQGNFFLKEAIAKLIPAIEVSEVLPGSTEGIYLPGYDVVVCDGRLPSQVPEGVHYLFLNCLPPNWEGFTLGAEIKEPPVVDWFRRHPVTREITFSALNVQRATKLTVPEFALKLVETSDSPLVAAWEKDETRAVIVSFDVLDSDWPLRLSFPLFVSNCVDWLAAGAAMEAQAQPHTGDSFPIRFGPGESKVTVTSPGGASVELEGAPGSARSFAETETAGLYTVARGAGTETIAVNLADPNESSGRVAEAVSVDEVEHAGRRRLESPPSERWLWFGWGAVALLLLEWLVYHRRVEFL